MRHSLSIGGSSSVLWRKVGRRWRLQMCFRHLLCVRIEIDHLQCVNCWVISHCLSVGCTKINHSRYALVIWSSLQLTSKQWVITQQFTARSDLFLKYRKKPFITGQVLLYGSKICRLFPEADFIWKVSLQILIYMHWLPWSQPQNTDFHKNAA